MWFRTSRSPRPGLSLGSLYAAIVLAVLAASNLERATWRFTTLSDVIRQAGRTLLAVGIFAVLVIATDEASARQAQVLVLAWCLHLGALFALLALRNLTHERSLLRTLMPLAARRHGGRAILVAGSLDLADSFLRELARDPRSDQHAIGLLALDRSDIGKVVRGLRVSGALDAIETTVQGLADRSTPVSAIVFTAPAEVIRSIPQDTLGRLKTAGIALLRLPALHEINATSESLPAALRELGVEELLDRPVLQLDLERIHELVNGKRILVTGAGGSIGSELCRQAAAFGCAQLTLLDHCEFGLFRMSEALNRSHPNLDRRDVLCDIRDRARVLACVRAAAPDIIFHAAALKHVPLVETHPAEGLLTNVVGTWNVAEAARAARAEQFVVVSTDKAVDPVSVMGATKRLAEAVARAQQGRSRTQFSVVRFGNVLGSTGSVVPTFQRQIELGGPVTITHPDVERYFMTIPESVQLVLHATAESAARDLSQPSVFVLDMGKPVKILDLARSMISLHGLRPGVDIPIVFTGLRPGERLTETLIDRRERTLARRGPVLEVVDRGRPAELTSAHVYELEALARAGSDDPVRLRIFAEVARLRGFHRERLVG